MGDLVNTIPQYPPPYMHSSIAQMQLQRDWWKARALEAMELLDWDDAAMYANDGHSLVANLRKAISEAREKGQ